MKQLPLTKQEVVDTLEGMDVSLPTELTDDQLDTMVKDLVYQFALLIWEKAHEDV